MRQTQRARLLILGNPIANRSQPLRVAARVLRCRACCTLLTALFSGEVAPPAGLVEPLVLDEPLPADPERPYVPEGAQRSHV